MESMESARARLDEIVDDGAQAVLSGITLSDFIGDATTDSPAGLTAEDLHSVIAELNEAMNRHAREVARRVEFAAGEAAARDCGLVVARDGSFIEVSEFVDPGEMIVFDPSQLDPAAVIRRAHERRFIL